MKRPQQPRRQRGKIQPDLPGANRAVWWWVSPMECCVCHRRAQFHYLEAWWCGNCNPFNRFRGVHRGAHQVGSGLLTKTIYSDEPASDSLYWRDIWPLKTALRGPHYSRTFRIPKRKKAKIERKRNAKLGRKRPKKRRERRGQSKPR